MSHRWFRYRCKSAALVLLHKYCFPSLASAKATVSPRRGSAHHGQDINNLLCILVREIV